MGKELEQIEPTEVQINLGGKKRQIKCTLYTWKKLQNLYGTITNISTQLEKDMQEKPLDILPKMIIWCINPKEVEEDELTEEQILLEYESIEDLRKLIEIVMFALKNSMPKNDKKKVIAKK